jgi:hypothetical protein
MENVCIVGDNYVDVYEHGHHVSVVVVLNIPIRLSSREHKEYIRNLGNI